jgi:hypothetical protein
MTQVAAMTAIGSVRSALLDLYTEHLRSGALPTAARFFFYERLTLRVLSKERHGARRPDQILHDTLTDLREDGRIQWDDIVDETRSVEDCTGHASVLDGVLAILPGVVVDPWGGQAPFVLTESRSLAGVLRSIISEYRARICSTNDRCGGFLHTNIAPLRRAPSPAREAPRRARGSRGRLVCRARCQASEGEDRRPPGRRLSEEQCRRSSTLAQDAQHHPEISKRTDEP